MSQLWTSRVGECLFCSFRPKFPPATTARSFTSTSPLERTTPKSHSKKRKGPFNDSLFGASLRTKYDEKFEVAVEKALEIFKKDLHKSDPLHEKWHSFHRQLTQAARLRRQGLSASETGNLSALRLQLYEAHKREGIPGITQELGIIQKDAHFKKSYGDPYLEEQKKAADLRYPAEWYPNTRSMQRTIHLHVGPTNSGKTYRALKRLEQAKHGFYAGPLRLLAQEVYSRFTAQGISCGLVTGDDVRVPDVEPRVISNTVEMVSIYKDYDVGVIDEIQMISDKNRGWAWTRAFLGSRAKELHVCGEERAVPLIKELTTLMGDNLEIHRYQRLNSLKVESTSLKGDLGNLRKGDCVVAFSRVNIHALKEEIEQRTGKRAAIVYGGLPAEIRAQQASLFNDPDNNYDYLVASDAIGMGLNLKCKRVIFQTLVKGAWGGLQRISIPEIKQIAGRAGRYRASNEINKQADGEEENVGWVTSLEDIDLPFIQKALNTEPPPLLAAGVIPTDSSFHRIGNYFPPNVSSRFLMNRVCAVSEVHPLFFMCKTTSQNEIAAVLDKCDQLSIEDQLIFMAAPLTSRDQALINVAKGFIRCVAENTSGHLLDIPELNLEILEAPVSGRKEYINELESLHKSLILYLWLSYRMGGVFTDRTLAMHAKTMVEEQMMRALSEFSANSKLRKDASKYRQMMLAKQHMLRDRLLAGTQASNEPNTQSTGDNAESLDDAPVGGDISLTKDARSEVQAHSSAR